MTTYYVRKTGNDSNAGTSAGAAWLTIDKAANTVAAADTVYVGAGVYPELVTMDTSGTSGNQISYIADVDGSQTGDAGLVVVSAYDNELDYSNQRAAAWNFNGKEFITIRGFVLLGDYAIYDNQVAGNRAYEGVIIEDCVLRGRSYGCYLDLNDGATPTANGLTIRRCVGTNFYIRHDTNASAHVNAKITLENLLALTYIAGASTDGIYFLGGTTGNSFSIGGVTIANCTVFAGTIRFSAFKNTTNVTNIYSPVVYSSTYVAQASLGTATAIYIYNIVQQGSTLTSYTGVTAGDTFYLTRQTQGLLGGIDDFPLRRFLGWSPFQPFEPVNIDGYANPLAAFGMASSYLPTEDLYNSPRGMDRPTYSDYYYFDASDAAPTDPNSVWIAESNAFSGVLDSLAFTSTAGSSSSNYMFAEGTNAPGSGGTIIAVYVRPRVYRASGSGNMGIEVFTDGVAESLGTLTFALQTTREYHDWQALSTPTGGWSWAKLQALELKIWADTGSAANYVDVIQLAVATDDGHADAGAVEARARPEQEATTINGGTYSARFEGGGYYDAMRAVDASSTTITVYCRKDSNYSGTAPKLEVVNIPGVSDQSDSLSVGADTWEQLSVSFTPTAAGWVRVRLWSYDESASGQCFFDDLAVS